MNSGDVEDEYPDSDEGLEFALFLRKQALERSGERAFNIFDGGETVYVKIVDEEGTEYVRDYTSGGDRWELKVRAGSRRLRTSLPRMVLQRLIGWEVYVQCGSFEVSGSALRAENKPILTYWITKVSSVNFPASNSAIISPLIIP
jgi:hypothetical protein